MEAARCMLIDAGMEKKYWAEAVNTACYLQNILPSKAVTKTPFELWNNRKANVEHLHIFGCKAYTHIPKEKRRKLDNKAILFTFVGYSAESKAYRMLDKVTNKITISRDVRFIEHELKKGENTGLRNKEEEMKNVSVKDKVIPIKRQEATRSDEAVTIFEDEFEDEQDQDLNESLEEFAEAEDGQATEEDEQQVQSERDIPQVPLNFSQDSILEQSLPIGDATYICLSRQPWRT
jgi:hypothetical protein